ncbi:MAG: ArsR family transcriptional regulator [Candidatus Bathyarchaeota archaeon]|nr:transcriptional regulator [Candidatus Bathyarchaeota archaeon]MCZ2845551.1 ArsR family transcriptional regulator [Candidatus Bathyarchaeota archaeon]
MQSLESGDKYLSGMREKSNLTDSCIRYHLKTLRREGIVKKANYSRPFQWTLTGKGQQKLL